MSHRHTSRVDLLVTGATGFVGSHLVRVAQERGVDTGISDVDLTDRDAVYDMVARLRPRQVVHLARSSGMDPWAELAHDLQMTGNLFIALSELTPDATVLLPGSAAQYGMGTERPLLETDPTIPLTTYAAAKNCLEAAVVSTPLSGDLRTVWARSFNLIGPGQPADAPLAHWASQVAECEQDGGGTVRVGNLDVTRDFLDVRDVADAYLALCSAGISGVVNVCSGRPTRLDDLLGLLLDLADAPLTVTRDPDLERTDDPPYVVGDPTRLRELTGWQPRIRQRETVQAVLGAWRQRVNDRTSALRGGTGG